MDTATTQHAPRTDARAHGIYVNLPVADLDRSVAFYRALGFAIEPRFTDHTAACVVLGGGMCLMLLTHAKFAQFTPRKVADARASSEVLVALALESRDAVASLVARALASGGAQARPPEDYGFMYQHAFEDPDGHIFEPFWMDMERFDAMRSAQAAAHASGAAP